MKASVRPLLAGTALTALALLAADPSRATEAARTELKPFNVTIRVFDPAKGAGSGQDYVLPVDSPDEAHAIASTTANAASFTRTVDGGKPLPVAFTCVRVEPRP